MQTPRQVMMIVGSISTMHEEPGEHVDQALTFIDDLTTFFSSNLPKQLDAKQLEEDIYKLDNDPRRSTQFLGSIDLEIVTKALLLAHALGDEDGKKKICSYFGIDLL